MESKESRKKQHKVSFSNVEVRNYPIIINNYPGRSVVPSTLSWESTNSWSIDEFESVRRSKREIIDESGWKVSHVKSIISTEDITKVTTEVSELQKIREKTITEIRISTSYDKIAKYDCINCFISPIAEILEN